MSHELAGVIDREMDDFDEAANGTQRRTTRYRRRPWNQSRLENHNDRRTQDLVLEVDRYMVLSPRRDWH
jgi:hypothetical protein